MAKAMLLCERQPDGEFKPVTVFLAVKNRLQMKTLPGSARRDAFVARVTANPGPDKDPQTGQPRSVEAWLENFALDAYSNGHATWTVMVEPTLTIDELYQREVLGIEPKRIVRPELQPTTEAPTTLGGRKKVKP